MTKRQLIEHLNKLNGTYQIFRFNEKSPIQFLLDEKHHNQEVIQNNIDDAKYLITNCNVCTVGVESHSGGLTWDQSKEEYTKEGYYDNELVSTCPDFYDSISKLKVFIHGVECQDMLDKIHCHLSVNDNPYFDKPIKEHPLHFERSKHFIETIFMLKKEKELEGNLILNCGSNHNDDIIELLENDEINQIINIPFSIVRINSIKQ